MRDYSTLQEQYTDLLRKSEESKIAVNLERRQIGEQFKVIDGARLPERPISPDRLRINLMGLLAGLGVRPRAGRFPRVSRHHAQDRRRCHGEPGAAGARRHSAMVTTASGGGTARRRRMVARLFRREPLGGRGCRGLEIATSSQAWVR